MFSFPPVRGYAVVHVHEEGERCVWSGPRPCRYVPTIYGRFRGLVLAVAGRARKWWQSWR